VDILSQLFPVFNIFLRHQTDFRGLLWNGAKFVAQSVKIAKKRLLLEECCDRDQAAKNEPVLWDRLVV
jgi:hypothetical protein